MGVRRYRVTVAALLGAVLIGCGAPIQAPMLGNPQLTGILGKGLAPAGKFTLATYNMENLFDGSNVVLDPRMRPAKPHEEKQALAKGMYQLNADVVGVVEVESKASLRNFRDSYLADMGYKYLALVEGNDFRGIDVGVLSRFPITHIASNKNRQFGVPGQAFPHGFSRDVLEARIQPGKGYSFTLFMTHLKARPGQKYSDDKRHAEAREIQQIFRKVEKQQPNANYVLMGDLNDRPTSETLNILQGKRDRDVQLYDALGELGPNAYTYHPMKYRGRIDYILLSQGMKREYVPGSARIMNTPETLAASDHLPAVVTIDASQDR